MRILLDILGMPPYGGARTAAIGWVTALATHHPNDYFLVLVNQLEAELTPYANIEQYVIATPGRLLPRLYVQTIITRLGQRYHIEVVHFLRNLAAYVPHIPVVVNINDLTRLLIPGTFSRWDILYWQTVQRYILPQAQRIICISKQTRRDLIHWLNYPPEKVVTIYPAIQATYQPLPEQETQSIRDKYHLPDKFILYVGGLAKHKNLPTLIRAFIRLKQTTTLPQVLVIVGGQFHTHNDDITTQARQLPPGQMIFTGSVPDVDLPGLYNAAELFVFPTQYEGFGLAPLEAMACGTPVIASRVGSLPEVLGQAAYWVDDPLDEGAFTNAMHYMLLHQAKQTDLIEQGLTQANCFSWEATAQQTRELYQDIVKGNS